MYIYGLIGKELQHSFSKKYFTEKFEESDISNSVYKLFPISDISFINELISQNKNIKGLNVTVPYKTEVLDYVDEKSETVKEVNACNTILIEDDKLKAFNTDVIGFEISLLKFLGEERPKALILGSGGASKAVSFVLEKLNIEHKIVSRRMRSSGLTYQNLTDEQINEHKLIINTTPLGTYPNNDTFPQINYHALGLEHYLYDLNYNPELTKFLEFGSHSGAKIKNGLEMLKIQADESWKIWCGEH